MQCVQAMTAKRPTSKKENKPHLWKIIDEKGQILDTLSFTVPTQYFFTDAYSEDKKLNKLLTKAMLDMNKLLVKEVRIFGSEEHFSDWLHTANYALGDQAVRADKEPRWRR